jgi:formylglycine-generating enzyme required for sulfatase activity
MKVPAGSFTMGSHYGNKDEKPVHRVTLEQPLAVGKFEVSFAEWDACVLAGGCQHKPDDNGWGRGNRPVINVSWNDAQHYVRWLRVRTGNPYRLPSEAEWEYVARAGADTAYWWGGLASRTYANHGKNECCGGAAVEADKWLHTAPVGSFPANGFNIHDTIGNVWEWVQDCWNKDYSGAPSDGSEWNAGSCGKRAIRGGSWDSRPGMIRSANRGWGRVDERFNYLGFRVVRSLPGSVSKVTETSEPNTR